MVRRLATLSILLALTLAAISPGARAQGQAFPVRPLKLIVAFPPGGVADQIMRVVATRLGEVLGQTVVVENRTGASGNIGAVAAARSPADGYTLFNCGVASHGMVPALFKTLPYDPEKDFLPLSKMTSGPNVLVVHPAVPARTVQEFMAWAKGGDASKAFASAGIGTSPDMAMELLKQTAGLKLERVAYRGNAPAITDVIAGHVPTMFSSIGDVSPYIRNGQLRAIAVSSLQRNAALPDVPTFDEAGVKGYQVLSWNHLCTPAGVPEPVMQLLHAALIKTLTTPATRERLTQMGLTVEPSSREELAAFIRDELTKWRRVAEKGGISLE